MLATIASVAPGVSLGFARRRRTEGFVGSRRRQRNARRRRRALPCVCHFAKPVFCDIVGVSMGVEAQMPMLVGRGEELRGLESFLDAVERGPAALVFEGDAGIGKTSLWRVGVDAAESRGHHVL